MECDKIASEERVDMKRIVRFGEHLLPKSAIQGNKRLEKIKGKVCILRLLHNNNQW